MPLFTSLESVRRPSGLRSWCRLLVRRQVPADQSTAARALDPPAPGGRVRRGTRFSGRAIPHGRNRRIWFSRETCGWRQRAIPQRRWAGGLFREKETDGYVRLTKVVGSRELDRGRVSSWRCQPRSQLRDGPHAAPRRRRSPRSVVVLVASVASCRFLRPFTDEPVQLPHGEAVASTHRTRFDLPLLNESCQRSDGLVHVPAVFVESQVGRGFLGGQ